MLIYIGSSLQVITHEALHLVMHVGDIINLDFTLHSNQCHHSEKNLSHHHQALDNTNESSPDGPQISQQILDKDIEYSDYAMSYLDKSMLYDEFNYLNDILTLLSFDIDLPPPKVNS